MSPAGTPVPGRARSQFSPSFESVFMRLRLIHRLPCGLPAVLLLAGFMPDFAQDIAPRKPGADPPTANTPELKVAGTGNSAYRIGVGDVLHVSVWEEPQFTEAAVVRPDGMISIPLISEVVVAGLTPESAETMLTARLEKFVHNPRVTVVVQELHSRIVYITAEERRAVEQ